MKGVSPTKFKKLMIWPFDQESTTLCSHFINYCALNIKCKLIECYSIATTGSRLILWCLMPKCWNWIVYDSDIVCADWRRWRDSGLCVDLLTSLRQYSVSTETSAAKKFQIILSWQWQPRNTRGSRHILEYHRRGTQEPAFSHLASAPERLLRTIDISQ